MGANVTYKLRNTIEICTLPLLQLYDTRKLCGCANSVLFLTFLHHLRDIKDPEHPYSLEELKVITEDAIELDAKRNYVRYKEFPCIAGIFYSHTGTHSSVI